MKIKLNAIGSVNDSPCYIIGRTQEDKYIVFDLLAPTKSTDLLLGDILEIEKP